MIQFLKKCWPQKIRYQLILGVTLVHLVLMTIFIIDLVSRQHTYMVKQNIQQVESLAKTFAINASGSMITNDLGGLEEIVLAHKSFPHLRYAMILSTDGVVLAHTNKLYIGNRLADTISLSLKQLQKLQILISNKSLLDVASPVLNSKNEIIGWVRIGQEQQYIYDELWSISKNGVLYTLFAILVGSFFALLLGNFLTKNLKQLLAVTEKIKAGQHNVRVAPASSIEVSTLGLGINQMLDEIESRNAQLNSLSDNLPESIMYQTCINSDGKPIFLYLSKGIEKYTGVPAAVVMQDSDILLNILHKKDVAYYMAARAASIKNVCGLNVDVRFINPQNETRWINIRSTPRVQDNGVVIWDGIFTDITNRKKAAAALEASEERFRSYVENANDTIFSLSPDGLLLYISPNWEKSLGYKINDVLNQPVFQTLIHPEDAPTCIAALQRGISTGKSQLGIEYRVMHKDGSVHHFIANATPILNAAGKVVSIQGISHDITKQKQADKALKKSEEQYRTLFDKAIDGILLVDMDGNIFDANNAAAAMHGYSIAEMKTKSLGTLVCPAERPLIAERTKAIFEKDAFHFEAKHCDKDGHLLLLDVVANSIELNGEKFVLAFLRDIREQKQAAIALKESEEKFSKIFHLSPDVILLSRISDGVIVDVNERAFDLAGYKREEVLGMTTMELNGWDDLAERGRYVTQLMQHGHVSSFEKKFKIKSGEYKDTTISGELIELNGEKFILTVIHDISEQKNTARKIIESEELLNQTGQLAKVGGWTFNVLTNEIIWTKETYRMCELPLDYKPDVASILQFYHPNDRETINQLVTESVQSGKSFETELRAVSASGKVAWINTVINAIKEDGRVVKVIGALQDITERKNAEAAIRESEDKFSKAFHASPDVLMLSSFPDGTIIDANQTVFDMFGYHRSEMLGKTTIETKIWGDLATRDRYIALLKKQGSVHNFETAFNTQKGVEKFALVSAEFIELQGKRILLSIIRDITQHKEAEKKIQESETKYRQLFERNPMPVFLYQSSDLRIVDINEATIQHYGYSREEFKQMTIRDMRPDSELEKLDHYFNRPRPKGFINAGLWKHKKKDGTIIDVEVVSNDFEVNNMPCRIVLCKDVTEKQKAEEALAESERKYRNMVELNQAGIYQSSVTGEILSCNSAFANMLGYDIHDLVQNKKADIFYFKNTERDKFIQQLQKNNGLNNYEAELKHREGYVVNVLENCFLRKDAKGDDIIEGTMIDITRRKKAEREIKKLNRLYLLITQINDLILKSTNNDDIYEAVCRIAVKQGKFRMAWIGAVDESAALIKPLTWAGHEEGYLQEINISTTNDPDGLGPTGKAVKLGRYHFSNDIMNDRSMLPWKEKALAHGFYSSISLPLFVQGKVIAAFTIYSAESFFFNASEIKLLEEVTANISYALDKIWIENMRKIAEEALKKSMREIADYKYAIDQSAIVSITDNDGVIKYVNNNFCNMYGFTQEEAIGKNHNTIINSGYHPHSFWKNFWKTIQQGKVLKAEVCNMAKDGSLHWQDTTIIPFLDLEGKPYQYLAIRTDITKKRKLEIELAAEQLNHQKVITEVTIQAQEKERNQLGRELHDNINQILATVKMYLGLAKSKKRIPEDLVEKGYNYLDDAIKEIRTLSHSLVAPSLGDVGLEEALTDISYAINAGSGVHLKVINQMDKRKKIDTNKKIMLYRIVQEQINNITKYAKAASATILLETKGKNIQLSITDDGVGFDVNQKARGIGLQNIQSRVEFYAGKMDIVSAPGKGCTLKIAVPY